MKYGPVASVKVVPTKNCAFVHFAARKAAEEAIKDLYGNFVLKGVQLSISWSRGSR